MVEVVEPVKRPLSRRQAQQLTEKIRQTAEECWRLLCEAREREAWKPLGYPSWDEYVRTEFGMTDRNARYLLMQGETVSRLEAAADVRLPPGTISVRDARAVAPRVDEIAGVVERRVRRQPKSRRAAIVAEVVSEAVAETRPAVPAPEPHATLSELVRLLARVNPVVAARESTPAQRRAIEAWWEAYRLAVVGKPSTPQRRDRPASTPTRSAACDHPTSARVSQGKGRGFRCRLCGATVTSAA